jgi:transcriptional regulator with XRE-family HTH domain
MNTTERDMSIPWKGDLLTLMGRIHRARKAAKMTQAEAGAIIGVTDRTYREYESGDTSMTADDLFQLAAALGIRVFDPETESRKETSGFKVAA